ncbi:ankyrin repeat and SOCS box protein 15 isoform X1 [Lepisosteus oculatus]|uniref:ankyrin repeat and SOCS box protein 15 isoform X1 n=1 Tax=Lepisosteus oculatus TaxID=7918 RepID=UPI0003EAD4CE|nr:PREDICTED: ankyrin repeat and SOCS box protein 15 isoform X1 [Lepisosteus oculatus]XP_015207984.1 PREDICTED: ankyrin repeat and SOCS box protein 15 isoform X1 [Lepisosteus oculatus]XP_015207985.1 PREDICTED: ankyrin repeat and SOCS box protein 15 isoform X1 [Lepisosteus oculatus]XP_015207986.1 PREDICTED: ankyrin repeat and SOCS box protein 15 isoform X1 [Lepisosteus oculatus]XP_015207987.1 PREDICTED: ankyrin repeat and SOCS box protein 15 isoform X1 [Lepisosteus oculatus]
MENIDKMDEDQLTEYAIQLSIQESFSSLLIFKESLESVSHENQRIMEAIRHGEIFLLQQLAKVKSAFHETDERRWFPFHEAVVQPILQILEIVLDASCEVSLEETTLDGETALTLAVQAGHVQNVRALLEKGASPHNANRKNETPLLLAVRSGSREMVSTLIKNGAFVDQLCLKKWTAVHEAAKMGQSDIMSLLLRNGGSISQRDVYGVTPLGIAAEYAHADVLEILIHKGGDVNAQSDHGESVLFDAASGGNPDCIELLLEYGASPNIPNLSGHLPIHRAAYGGHYLAVKILIPVTSRKAIRDSGQSPVHSAADGGNAQCLELLIENGFDVNVVLESHISDNYEDARRTPLYFAVSNGDVTCTELLLKHGAATNKDPLKCLLVAVRAMRYEIVRLLLAYGADINCYFTMVHDTIFPSAIQYCLKDEMMMRLLLNNGYDAEKCFCCDHDISFLLESQWVSVFTEQREFSLSRNEGKKTPFCDFITVSWMSHLAGNLVKILLDYVNHVPICSKLKAVLGKQKEWAVICDILENPRPLKHLCRLVIRKQITLKRLKKPEIVSSLPIPTVLQHYILYREYDLYGRSIHLTQ